MSDFSYPVVEIFLSVQGEGKRVGTLNHFIRLAGCNLKCPFCDTEFQKPQEHLRPTEIVERLEEQTTSPQYWRRPSVVITGGEPFVHNLHPLVWALRNGGYYVAVETNGTLLETPSTKMVLPLIDWVTVSPKTKLSDEVLNAAHEVKYVIPDMEHLVIPLHRRLFFQPEWNNPEAVKRCLELMKKYPHGRLSIQTHKFVGLR